MPRCPECGKTIKSTQTSADGKVIYVQHTHGPDICKTTPGKKYQYADPDPRPPEPARQPIGQSTEYDRLKNRTTRPLGGPAQARHTDPETSHEAAERKTRLHEHDVKILSHLRDCRVHGLPEFSVSALIVAQAAEDDPIDRTWISPRFKRLEEKGLIYREGVKTNPATNRTVTCWKISDRGLEELESALSS